MINTNFDRGDYERFQPQALYHRYQLGSESVRNAVFSDFLFRTPPASAPAGNPDQSASVGQSIDRPDHRDAVGRVRVWIIGTDFLAAGPRLNLANA